MTFVSASSSARTSDTLYTRGGVGGIIPPTFLLKRYGHGTFSALNISKTLSTTPSAFQSAFTMK